MKRTILSFLAVAALAAAPACVMDGGFDKPDTDDTKVGPNGKAEGWSQQDAPDKFANDLIRTLGDLPQVGEAEEIPWAGYYWAVAYDSVNKDWAGNGNPPTKKYANAFNKDPQYVMDQVSRYHGIDSQSHRKDCTSNSDCTDNSGICAKRAGQTEGYCIPTWFGLCHAWAPLAILLPEPLHEVEFGGETFKVQDIKALLTLIYNRTVTRFVSLRCNTDAPDVHFDNYGRPTGVDSECRDTNPGTLHLLLTNYLGIRKASFVEDRTWDDEVWNQPIRGYNVREQREVSAREANELIGVTSAGGRTETASATVAKNEWYHMDPIAVSSGEGVSVVMTGDNDADLYVRFGAQPTADEYDCRPYAGGSDEDCSLTASANGEVFVSVQGYADSSIINLTVNVGGSVPDAYEFNNEADTFYYVHIDVHYITESSASTDGNLAHDIDRYTNTDTYEYILETKTRSDGKKEIIGGEYIGSSKKNHPDFLWLPVSHRNDSAAGGAVSRAEVMQIYELSRQTGGGGGGGGGELKTFDANDSVVQHDAKRYGPFQVKAGETFTITMTGDNDADLYVRSGAAPTSTSYDCRPYRNGSSEECSVVSNGQPIHVAVFGYAASSNFSLHAEYVEGGGSTPPPPPPPGGEVTHLNVQDSIAQGESKHYTLELPSGYATKIQTFSDSDVDLYIQMNQAPTTSAYVGRAWTTSGNETLSYTPSGNGTLHIMVHGYEAASSFTLRTSAQ
jgi:hypothetical protein